MKTYRAFSRLILAIAALLSAGGGSSALAQTGAGGGRSPGAMSVALVLDETGPFVEMENFMLPIRGTVDGSPESIRVTGRVGIQSTLVLDPDFAIPPTLRLRISLANVSGRGTVTGETFKLRANQVEVTRQARATDVVELEFPLFVIAGGPDSPPSGRASLMLRVNRNTGAIVSGSANVSTPGN